MAIAVGTFDDAKTDKDGAGGGGGVLDAFESTQIAFFDIIFASSKGDKDSNRTRSSLCCALLFMSLSLVDESSAKARVVNDAPRGRRRRRKEEGRRTDDDDESDDFDCATQHMMR